MSTTKVHKNETITVRSCKYDDSEHRRWSAQVIRREGSLLVLDAKFDQDIEHELLGTIQNGTLSLEYYWLDRWYNIFRFSTPSRELRSYYCNINIPPTLAGRLLSYVDLDIDILVEPDFSFRVVDREEFERNAARYGYSEDVRVNSENAVQEVIDLIRAREFPFNL